MMSLEKPGQVITFYSYKGGTGRSMALANVACLLAQRQTEGKGVLMVDWDLEAPGLHRFFRDRFERRLAYTGDRDRALDREPGLIDLFMELDAATQSGEEWTEENTSDLFDTVKLEQFVLETDIPSLHLLKAGRFDEKHSSHVNTFPWEALYHRVPWLIRSLAERLAEQYEYVLIDSRTGFTDISGICTMLMPDKLVVVFTPNRQNLLGIVDLVRRVTNYRKQSDDWRPLVLFPLPSRIEMAEPTLRDAWRYGDPDKEIIGYQPQLEEIFQEVYDLPKCDLESYFDEVQVQHVPSYAYGEEIAVLVERGKDRLSLTRSYESFSERLVNLSGPWEQLDRVIPGVETGVEEIHGPVLSGDEYHGPVTVTTPLADPAALQAAYLSRLMRDCERLPLRGVDVGAADPSRAREQRLSLAQVYVELDTKTQVPVSFLQALAAGQPVNDLEAVQQQPLTRTGRSEELRPLSALNATIANRRLVLLGDPGSGKSTFVNHLALCLAGAALESNDAWVERLPGWPEGEQSLIPLPVALRDFGRWLARRPASLDGTHPASARVLWDFTEHWLADGGLAAYGRHLLDALLKGGVMVLLDGLDEIPGVTERSLARDAVADFAASYRNCRMLVTCRTLSYADPAWQLPPVDFWAFELAPLNEEKIDRFITAWYAELAYLGVVSEGDARALAGHLRNAVRWPDLWRLALNPLLLTVIALVHTHKGRLPEARALLYEDCVDLLLWRWEEVKRRQTTGARTGLRQLLLDAGLQDVDLKRALWRIAFDAQARLAGYDEATADVAQADLLKVLRALHPDQSWDWAQAVIDQMKERAGLLVERQPEVYTFPHRTIQEYLAGCHLSTQGNFAREAAALAAKGPLWHEIVLLAVGRLVHLAGDTDKPLALATELCPDQATADDAAWRAAWLAGQVLIEVGLPRVHQRAWGRELLARVQRHLAALVETGALSPVERSNAADVLAVLGDARAGVGLDAAIGLPDLVWCPVPAGSFLMGSTDADEMAYDDEKPQHEVTLPAFKIGKYLITNAQFQTFVDDPNGYRNDAWWTPDGLEWRGDRTAPRKYGGAFDPPNHPVVGVAWYAAVAFCRWLTAAWQARGVIADNEVVRLPTEAEWEKTARGTDGRVYSWGNEFDPAKCNMGNSDIGTTSTVGIFPSGASPYGALDLSGNVLEWCATRWQDEYPLPQEDAWSDHYLGGTSPRVLRDGGFDSHRQEVRCTVRGRELPEVSRRNLGFRVVISPVDKL